MIDELKKIEQLIWGTTVSEISNLTEDEGAQEYFGYSFEVKELKFRFRKAKITPKKTGQFVTLWKRNSSNETEPFHESDAVDFYIIATEEKENSGFFLFPKNELIKRQILTTSSKEGKRGFRVYPTWTETQSNQAAKSQIWQVVYFSDVTIQNSQLETRLIQILTKR